jgi:hypothetical protein
MTIERTPRRPAPRSLWIVGILALLWNGFAAFDYLATQLELDWYLAGFTPEQREIFTSFPAWSVAGWAVGVWGGVAGSAGLLLRGAWAVWAFAVSLAGVAVTTYYQFVFIDWTGITGTAGIVASVIIWIIAVALLWYAVRQRKNGVLG